MKICPSCGAPNDPANRFCEQCGARLVEAAAPAPAEVPAATAPSAIACPTCGAPVLPGEAFCDDCGADLTALAPAVAPVSAAAAPAAAPASAPPAVAEGQLICAICGATALPGERFCDNCGADLFAQINAAAPAPAVPPPAPPDGGPVLANGAELPAPEPPLAPPPVEVPAAEAPTVGAPVELPAAEAPTVGASVELPAAEAPTVAAPVEVPPAEAPTLAAPVELPAAEAPTVAAPVEVPPAEAPTLAAPVEAAAEAPTLAAPVEVPPAEAPTLAAPVEVPPAEAPTPPAGAPVFDRATYEARRAELTATISRQQQIIAQLEQMQATFGAATPAAVITGLAEAREALTRAETELAALQAPAPAVDPAEVRRLQEEISRQQQIIAQLEQMQATFGAATPAAVITGLAEAREALARAEAALTALGLPSAPAAPTPVIEAPPPPPPAPSGPRLVVEESGAVLPLPLDKTDIIIGREDPVSNIFPEIDLTPHGGELGGVSRQHARLSHAGGQWTVTDLNSTNYTRLNGARLEPNVPTPIADGARLQFGRVVVIVHLR